MKEDFYWELILSLKFLAGNSNFKRNNVYSFPGDHWQVCNDVYFF